MAAVQDQDPTPAPWERVAPHEQLFVLITGANSGIGLAICERLIDEFLKTYSLTSHLVLLPTTRSPSKSLQTISHLRSYALRASESSRRFNDASFETHAARIHILSPALDLCDIRGVYELAGQLCEGTLSNPQGTTGQDALLMDVEVPRLDSVICNAAYGGWSGCNFPYAIWSFLFNGFVESVTRPKFKIALPTRLLNEQKQYDYPAKPLLGEVFTACVFGHYLLAHRLLPLLSRPTNSKLSPGRIIWSSSVEATSEVFSLRDMQSLLPSTTPYESAKRLTDLLCLTATLPSVKPISDVYLSARDFDDEDDEDREDIAPPRIYLTHPGVVVSTLFPLPWFLMWAYELALTLARYLGSPWHVCEARPGAASAVYITMQPQDALDATEAERKKWGSAMNTSSQEFVRTTEVDGWGFAGEVEDYAAVDESEKEVALRRLVGRKRGAKDVTEREIAEFEEVGKEVWEAMEEMREEWEEMLDL